jgi:hypothetical protein
MVMIYASFNREHKKGVGHCKGECTSRGTAATFLRNASSFDALSVLVLSI